MKGIKAAWKLTAVSIIVALLTMALPLGVSQVEASPGTSYVPDDYSTIQAAVNAASPDDTIIIRDGTYTENVDVNKDHLTIQSENGADSTIVQAADSNDSGFEIIA